jgi:Icc-related predicted phosphoesterase
MSSLKILVLSDLHLEFGNFLLTQDDADVIVLAGDIFTGTRGIVWARESLPRCPIIYVAGNHEHWGHRLPDHIDALRDAARGSNVYYLEDESVVIDGVTFHGATLWTDFALFPQYGEEFCMTVAREYMGDYRKITFKQRDIYRKLTPVDTFLMHNFSRAWLEKSLAESTTKTNVVVSHMAPSRQSIIDEYAAEVTSAAYASNLENLIATYQPALWVHGHCHNSLDYQLGDTRVVCNPRGYRGYGQNEAFNPQLIVSVDC